MDVSLFPEAAPATAIAEVAERIGDLVRTAADTAVRIPGAEWTVGEAAAHLVLANELMADLAAGRPRPYGDGTPGSLAAVNAAGLAGFTERRGAVLADGIVSHAKAFTAAAAVRPPGEEVVTPMGPMDLGTLGSYLLTHMLGHGYDIALALRRPHMLDAANVALTLPFVTLAMPRVVDARAAAGHSACYDLRVRGGGGFTVTFTDGTAVVGAGRPRRPDCTIVSEPVTFLLIALGRCGPVSALTRGKILAWGRKPWLAPRFPRLFRAP
ncbi:maleylpyruvate isomerase family mycothiol-dependent enzyme [Actinacidiphila paucisporea]|uniref:TIGR03083 family protein n=1 Tax=Actinacidiphila paucisporea TaxID=310782 RepID=A0A1M7MVJ8_9ACTN|nr:maleylpyruvate isomerase family mycothiol-dependent enzyme [Actinacidiphila paucisporea]SHM95042.1 TIGR03083 family protein [Actinacidiphila paucisporea]